MRVFLVQQFLGALAQIAAALPLLLVTALLSHTLGLEIAGHFTIAAGLSAFAFSLASWGLRTHIVIDRLETFGVHDYVAARAIAIFAASITTWLVGIVIGISSELVAAVIMLRSCDSTIELKLAFDQVRVGNDMALKQYTIAHGAKLLAIVTLGATGFWLGPKQVNLEVLAISTLALALSAVALLLDIRLSRSSPLTLRKVSAIFLGSKWFASAEIGSAGITSAPRISLAWLYRGTSLGIAGTSLSVAGFFGMAFYTSWLRFLPRFSASAQKTSAVRSFLLESLGIAVILAVVSAFALPTIAGYAFGFREAQQISLSHDVLLASVLFFVSMNIVNLFKISRHPWMETVAYISTCSVTVAAAWVFPSLRGTPQLLAVAGVIMLGISIPNLINLLKPACTDALREFPQAIFTRIASRPIPRVTRMMQVAIDLGFECHFLGAMRDEDLARQDQWHNVPVTRLGPAFPLLNGTRPLTYVKSVVAFNFALYRVLKERRPQLVHASDCETMPAAILFRAFHRTRLIFNIHDNIAQRYNVPWIVAKALNAVEGIFVLFSDVAAVPEEFRRTALPIWCQKKVVVIRNTPIDPGASQPLPFCNKIRIFFGGWLDWGRGLKPLLELAAKTPEIELRIAGEGASSIVDEIRKNDNVVFLGFLDHEEVIVETSECHFVSAFYDPHRVINRFAASNKIAEALAVGRPILMNDELEIARDLAPFGCALSVPYAEISQMGNKIMALVRDEPTYRTACAKARAAYDAHYAWEDVRDKIVEIFGDAALQC